MANLEVNNHFGSNGGLGASSGWIFMPVFGIVHPTNCSVCHEYMTHVAFEHHTTSFKNALNDSENSHSKLEAFLEGFRRGFQLRHGSDAPAPTHHREGADNLGQPQKEDATNNLNDVPTSAGRGTELDKGSKSAEHSGETQDTAEDGVPAPDKQDDGSKSTEQPGKRAAKDGAPVPDAHHEKRENGSKSTEQPGKRLKDGAPVPDDGSKSTEQPGKRPKDGAPVPDDGSKSTEQPGKRPKDGAPVPDAHHEKRDNGSKSTGQPGKRAKDDAPVDVHHEKSTPSTPVADNGEKKKSILNTLEDLSQGIIKTRKHTGEYTILLVGETGAGKTSLLSLFYNILTGRSPAQYRLAHDSSNEAGGAANQSQTQFAKLYEFESNNGIKLRILDTPGLADTRGIEQDAEHQESIREAIQNSITTVDAVVILTNGTVPRLNVGTDYALGALSAMFHDTLTQSIAILFTNIKNKLAYNFNEDSLPKALSGDNYHPFRVNNPVALAKKYYEMRSAGNSDSEMESLIRTSHEQALRVMLRFFDWLDNLEPRPILDIPNTRRKAVGGNVKK